MRTKRLFQSPQVTEPKNSVLKEGQGNWDGPRLEGREQQGLTFTEWVPPQDHEGPSQASSLGLVQSPD